MASAGKGMQDIIWQYWETRGIKPAFVDGLHRLARRNCGCELIQVTPQTLATYLPDLPPAVHRIEELAHKADMIRAMLVERHGGMWLDSDAIVLRDLGWIFDQARDADFLGFNAGGCLDDAGPAVRVNCFVSKPGGIVVGQWARQQQAKLPRTTFRWEEIGTELLHPICLQHRRQVKMLPFERICPIAWDHVERFGMPDVDAADIIDRCSIVMLNHASLKRRAPHLLRRSCTDLAAGDDLLSSVMRFALRGQAVDDPTPRRRFGTTVGRTVVDYAARLGWRKP